MIIITATLSFETQEDRDVTVAKTADVQAATRNDEPVAWRIVSLLIRQNPLIFKYLSCGRMLKNWLRILITLTMRRWLRFYMDVMVSLHRKTGCTSRRIGACL